MKKIVLLFTVSLFLLSCDNKENDPEPKQEESLVAEAGKIKYKANGIDVTYSGSGYVFDTEYSLIKWESSGQQLSIDFYDMAARTYTVTNAARLKGNAKISYYPNNIAQPNTVYISKSGTFVVSSYTTTGGFKASGTFSATLEKSVNGAFTGEKIEITAGIFKDIALIDVR